MPLAYNEVIRHTTCLQIKKRKENSAKPAQKEKARSETLIACPSNQTVGRQKHGSTIVDTDFRRRNSPLDASLLAAHISLPKDRILRR